MRYFFHTCVALAAALAGMSTAQAQSDQVPLTGSASSAFESSSPLPPGVSSTSAAPAQTTGPVVYQGDSASTLPPQTMASPPVVQTVETAAAPVATTRPVVADVPDTTPPAATATTAQTPAAAPARQRHSAPQVGDLTRQLLAAQADPNRVAPALPMLGAEATVSWDRYMNSFKQPIPQFFKTQVQQDSGSSSGGSN